MAHYFLHSVLLAEASLITKSYNQTHSQGIEIQSPHFVEEKTAKSCGKEHDDKEGGKTGDANATYHQNNCILFKNVL